VLPFSAPFSTTNPMDIDTSPAGVHQQAPGQPAHSQLPAKLLAYATSHAIPMVRTTGRRTQFFVLALGAPTLALAASRRAASRAQTRTSGRTPSAVPLRI
jgi:hypothetical protein